MPHSQSVWYLIANLCAASFPVCMVPYFQSMWCLIPSLCGALFPIYVMPHSQSVWCLISNLCAASFPVYGLAHFQSVCCLILSLCDASFSVCVVPYSQSVWGLILSVCAASFPVMGCLIPSLCGTLVLLHAGSAWVSCLLITSSFSDFCVHHIWLDCSWGSFGQIHCYSAPGTPTCSSSRQGIHDQNTEEKGKDQTILILCQLLK